MWANIKLGLFLFIGVNILFFIFELITGDGFSWNNMQYSFWVITALMTIMTLWSFSGLKAIAGPSTEYFRMLGFADPEGVNLNNHIYFYEVLRDYRARGEEPPDSWYNASPFQYRNIYSLRAAIKAGKAKLISPKDEADVTTTE